MVLALLVVCGIGNTLTDISALTLMQRAVPDDVLARVFGVLESILLASLGAGALLAPLLIELSGIKTALVVTGLLLPTLVLLSSTTARGGLRRLARRARAAGAADATSDLRPAPAVYARAPGRPARRRDGWSRGNDHPAGRGGSALLPARRGHGRGRRRSGSGRARGRRRLRRDRAPARRTADRHRDGSHRRSGSSRSSAPTSSAPSPRTREAPVPQTRSSPGRLGSVVALGVSPA